MLRRSIPPLRSLLLALAVGVPPLPRVQAVHVVEVAHSNADDLRERMAALIRDLPGA
jgi:hypothetical protein